MHVVGVGEAVDAHATHLHSIIECSPAETEQQLVSMRETVATATPRLRKVEQALEAVNQRIDAVRDNSEATVADIQQLFNRLRKVRKEAVKYLPPGFVVLSGMRIAQQAIDKREAELIAMVEQATNDKLGALTQQQRAYQQHQRKQVATSNSSVAGGQG